MSAGAIGGASGGGNITGASGFGDLSSGQFIKIMMSELTNQDPFEPQDSSAMLEQLSSLRNIESQLNLQKQLENLVTQNQLGASATMIGKVVGGLDVKGEFVSGVVEQIRVRKGKPELLLDTKQVIPFENITNMTGVKAEDLKGDLTALAGDFNKDYSVDKYDIDFVNAKYADTTGMTDKEKETNQKALETDLALINKHLGEYRSAAISMDMNGDKVVDLQDKQKLRQLINDQIGLGDLNQDKVIDGGDMALWDYEYYLTQKK